MVERERCRFSIRARERERARASERASERERKRQKRTELQTSSHLRPAPALDAAHVLVDELGAVLEVVDPRLLVALLELLAEELFWGGFGVWFWRCLKGEVEGSRKKGRARA